jgi:hypothetical protein
MDSLKTNDGSRNGFTDGSDVPTRQIYSACGQSSNLIVRSLGAVVKSSSATGDTSSRLSRFNIADTTIYLDWIDC